MGGKVETIGNICGLVGVDQYRVPGQDRRHNHLQGGAHHEGHEVLRVAGRASGWAQEPRRSAQAGGRYIVIFIYSLHFLWSYGSQSWPSVPFRVLKSIMRILNFLVGTDPDMESFDINLTEDWSLMLHAIQSLLLADFKENRTVLFSSFKNLYRYKKIREQWIAFCRTEKWG